MDDPLADPFVVKAEVVRHHVELVGQGELQISVSVGEELGQLGFFGEQLDRLVHQHLEELASSRHRGRVACRNDLRELEQLAESLALGDALRAERNVQFEAEAGDTALDQRSHPWVHSAAKDQELAGAQMRRKRLHGGRHRLGSGLRCSSTGVPITTTMCSALETIAGSVVGTRRELGDDALEHLAAHQVRRTASPPDCTVRTAAGSMS